MISTIQRCLYEIHEAQRLGKKVTLCPFMYDHEVRWGNLQEDVCIANIQTVVDSEKAKCGQASDKEDIHTVICKLQNGFEGMNASVEKNRLEYLMNYPVHKITGEALLDSEAEQKERRRKAVELLASSIIVMIKRVHSLNHDVVSDFSELLKSKSNSLVEPIVVFNEWNDTVKSLISSKRRKLN